jgi:hypothetical protein
MKFLMNDFFKSLNHRPRRCGQAAETTHGFPAHLMGGLDPRIQSWIAGSSPAMRV